MTSVSSAGLNSISTIRQSLNSISTGADGSFDMSQVNSIMDLANQAEALFSTGNQSDEAKAQSYLQIAQSLTKTILSFFGSGNQKAEAERDVQNNQQNAAKNDADTQKISKETQDAITSNSNKIAEQGKVIGDAQTQIENDQKELEEQAQRELDEQIEKIEEYKAILSDGVSSPEEKEKALAGLQEVNANITALVAGLQAQFEAKAEAQAQVIDGAVQEIQTNVDSSVTAVSNGTLKLKEVNGKEQQVQVQNTTSETQGGTQVPEGTTLIATGKALESNQFTYAEGVKTENTGNDTKDAGTTRLQGALKVTSQITTTLGKMSQGLGNISTLSQSLVGSINGINGLIGAADTSLQSSITSIGSWCENVTSVNEEFASAIEDYQSNNGMNTNSSMNFWSTSQNNNNSDSNFLAPWQQSGQNDPQNGQNNENSDEVFKFDPQKFKVSFGV